MMRVLGMEARTNKPVYLFVAKDLHHPLISKNQLIVIGDRSSGLSGLGIFAYTNRMPVVINANICTDLSIVNGKEG